MERYGPQVVTPTGDDEAALIRAAKAGDSEAFGVLVRRYMPKALAFARQMTGGSTDAEDAVQDAFVKAYRSLGSFRGDAGFYTWFYRLLANTCIDHARHGGLIKRLFSFARTTDDGEVDDPLANVADTHPLSSPYGELEQKELRTALGIALRKLPEKQRAVFLLRHNEGMKTAQVAFVLGISEGTVKSHLVRAVDALRKGLKEYAR